MKKYLKICLALMFLMTVLLLHKNVYADAVPVFTVQPWLSMTGNPDEPYELKWKTDIVPLRFEICYWDGLKDQYVGTLTDTRNGSWRFGPALAGRYITIYAYYENTVPTRPDHVKSEGCFLKRDQMVFLSQPEIDPPSSSYPLRISWQTNFTPVKVTVRTYDDYGTVDFDEINSNLSSRGSYPFDTSQIGHRFFINVYYGPDYGDYITSRKFTLRSGMTPVYWDGAGVRWSNAGYDETYDEIGKVYLYASETGSWTTAYEVCSMGFVSPTLERVDFLHMIWNEIKEKNKDLYFSYGVKVYPRSMSTTTFSRINFAHSLDQTGSLNFQNASHGVWDDGYHTLYLNYLYAGVQRGGQMKITAVPQEGRRLTGWTCTNSSGVDDLTLKIPGAPFGYDENGRISVPYFSANYENATTIHDVHMNVTPPTAESSAAANPSGTCLTVPESQQKGFSIDSGKTFWCLNSFGRTPYTGSFRAGQTYYLCTTISAKPGYAFYYTMDDSGVCSMATTLHVGDETFACQAKTLTKVNDDLSVSFVIPVLPVPLRTVSFNMNGHGTAIPAQRVRSGDNAVPPATPAADGFRFRGWYTESACTHRYYFNTPVTADLTLYARWSETVDSIEAWVDYPCPGKTPAQMAVRLTGDTTGMRLQEVVWTYPGPKTMAPVTMSANETFRANVIYTLKIRVAPVNSSYSFEEGIIPLINGEPADVVDSGSGGYVFGMVCPPANVYSVSFESEYGPAIPTQYVKEGCRALEPEAPSDPLERAVFTGMYYSVVSKIGRPVLVPFDFNQPIQADTVIRLIWTKYVDDIRLWMDPPQPGQEAKATRVHALQGENGYEAELASWYIDSAGSALVEGSFENGRTYWFRIRVETLPTFSLNPSNAGRTIEIQNMQAGDLGFHRDDRNYGIVLGSYTVGSASYEIAFDAGGHDTDPDPLHVNEDITLRQLLKYFPLPTVRDYGWIMTGWTVNGDSWETLADDVISGDIVFTAGWIKEIRSVNLWADQPAAGQDMETAVVLSDQPENMTIQSAVWTGPDGNPAEDFTEGTEYLLTVEIAGAEGWGFAEPSVLMNGEAPDSVEVADGNLLVRKVFTAGPSYVIAFDTQNGEEIPSIRVPEGADIWQSIVTRFGNVPVLNNEENRHFAWWREDGFFEYGLANGVEAHEDHTLVALWKNILTRLTIHASLPMEDEELAPGITFTADQPITFESAEWTTVRDITVTHFVDDDSPVLLVRFHVEEDVLWDNYGELRPVITVNNMNNNNEDVISYGYGETYTVQCNMHERVPRATAILPAGLVQLDGWALAQTPFTSVVVPEGMTQILPCAFADCGELQRVYLPDSITHIADTAFEGCPDTLLFVGGNEYTEGFAVDEGYLSVR